MNNATNRREFLRLGATSLALASVTPRLLAADEKSSPSARKRPNPKAIMWGTVGAKGGVLEKMKAVKAAGFDAVEMNSHMDQAEVIKARDEVGLPIVSVCGAKHWAEPLSDSNSATREQGFAALQQTLRDAKAYGATSILLVPGKVTKEVNFDTCWQRSIEQITRAIPLASELGVKISIENVWNDFITSEDQAVKYLDAINSPWVTWHFDVGNIIRYGDPIAWIQAIGKRIARVHVKEYSRDRAMRAGDVWKGFNVALLEGANNWAGVMKALDEVGYTGPLITEQGGSLADLSKALDRIIAS